MEHGVNSFVQFMRDGRSEAGRRPNKSKFKGTPVHNALLTALGARIGHGARLQLPAGSRLIRMLQDALFCGNLLTLACSEPVQDVIRRGGPKGCIVSWSNN